MITESIVKYPRTPHLEGSRYQPGDEDMPECKLTGLGEGSIVVEEKLDGSNCGIRFSNNGELSLQSRGHYLAGGGRERQFDYFKRWASAISAQLRERINNRYVVYGEWLYAKHTVYYDNLAHYFVEFDVLDLHSGRFLSTQKRHELLAGLPVVSAPVLWQGSVRDMPPLQTLVQQSRFQTDNWRESLNRTITTRSLSHATIFDETDSHGLMEGLYLKVEDADSVRERYKYVRPSFLTAVEDSGSHWQDRPIIPNSLSVGTDIFRGAT